MKFWLFSLLFLLYAFCSSAQGSEKPLHDSLRKLSDSIRQLALKNKELKEEIDKLTMKTNGSKLPNLSATDTIISKKQYAKLVASGKQGNNLFPMMTVIGVISILFGGLL